MSEKPISGRYYLPEFGTPRRIKRARILWALLLLVFTIAVLVRD